MLSKVHHLLPRAFAPALLYRFSTGAIRFHRILSSIAGSSAEATRGFVDQMKSRGIAPDSRVHEILVFALCNERQFEQAKNYALEHQSRNERSLELVLVREAAKRGGAEVGMQIYYSLEKPNLEITKVLIRELKLKNEWHGMLEVLKPFLDSGYEKDTYIYNELLWAHFNLKNTKDVSKWMNEMTDRNVPMNQSSFYYFIKIYIAWKKHAKVDDLFHKFWELDNEQLSFNAIAAFIKFYSENEDWSRVESIFENLHQREIELNSSSIGKIVELGKRHERLQNLIEKFSALLEVKPVEYDAFENDDDTREILESVLLASTDPKVLDSTFSRLLDLNCDFSQMVRINENLKMNPHFSFLPRIMIARYKHNPDILDDVFEFAKKEFETSKRVGMQDFVDLAKKYLSLKTYEKVEEVIQFILAHPDMTWTSKTFQMVTFYLDQLRADGKLDAYINTLLSQPIKPTLIYKSLVNLCNEKNCYGELHKTLDGFVKFGFNPKEDIFRFRETREKIRKKYFAKNDPNKM
jgi:hypothetical protein